MNSTTASLHHGAKAVFSSTIQNAPRVQPLMDQTRKPKSKLIKLEREIGGVADRFRRGGDRLKDAGFNRRNINSFVKTNAQKLARVSASFWARGLAVALSVRKLVAIAIRDGSQQGKYKSNVVPSAAPTMRKKLNPDRDHVFQPLVISACFGLVGICGILILILFQQVEKLKTKIAQSELEFATTRAQLSRVEKLAQQPAVNETPPAKKAQTAHLALSFSDADAKLIRRFIRVLPPKPGALHKIHLGDDIKDSAMAPIPELLIEQLPKLRGARFSIDQDGAIIIVGDGSNRVDAVLSYN
jgi:hypothetical protein